MKIDDQRCPDCGAPVAGGQAGCQELFDELAATAYHDLAFAAVYDLAFDTYCMQHPERFGLSAKSYAAHLTRLCCGQEYGGDASVYRAIQKWLNGTVEVEKPPLLTARGQITVADIHAARPTDERSERVQAWARIVWAAYSSQHDLAHRWIGTALALDNGTKSTPTPQS